MKKICFGLVLVLALSLLLTACSSAQPATNAMTFTDGLGRTVSLAAPAQKIVSLAPSATEMLYAVGAGSQVIGRDSFSNYPEEAKTAADIGGSMGDYSYEAITALNPDLVVAAEINTADQVKALEDLGLTVYYIANPASFDDLFTTLEAVGQLTGHNTEAKALTASLNTRVQAVKETIAKAANTPLVFYELDGTDAAKPWTSGPGTYMDQLISMAGGKNVGAALTSSWAQISVEELLVQNPDFILLGDGAYGTTAEQVAARSGWEKIKAVENKQIFAFNDDLVSRAGPRLVEGLEELARTLHPELYK